MGQAEQTHPLYASDREIVDRLLAAQEPAEADLVDAARLLMRYQGFPGASDLQDDLSKVLRFWGLDQDALQERTRSIWAAGYRPAPAAADAVGSGFDTTDQETS
ncbi:MAG: DUF3288 family protein [Cyanobacteriota bacterium]|nr:DUF3288 family protein [Cyanobacteriota bacterium]